MFGALLREGLRPCASAPLTNRQLSVEGVQGLLFSRQRIWRNSNITESSLSIPFPETFLVWRWNNSVFTMRTSVRKTGNIFAKGGGKGPRMKDGAGKSAARTCRAAQESHNISGFFMPCRTGRACVCAPEWCRSSRPGSLRRPSAAFASPGRICPGSCCTQRCRPRGLRAGRRWAWR